MEALYRASLGAGYDQNCIKRTMPPQMFCHSWPRRKIPLRVLGSKLFAVSTGGGERGGRVRDYALPVVVYATDNELRDPEAGYNTPGGCPMMQHNPTWWRRSTNWADTSSVSIQFLGALRLTRTNGSVGFRNRLHGRHRWGGLADDPRLHVVRSSATFRETITAAIEDLVYSLKFSRVELQIEGDEWAL